MFKRNMFLVLAMASVFSCVKKSEYTPSDVKIDIKYQDFLNSLKSGGQPGEITLNGMIINSDGTLNQKITIEQNVGKSEFVTKISEKQRPKLNADLKRKDDYKPSNSGTYLNIGCDLKNDARVEGLKEQKNKPNEFGITDLFGPAASMVDKIFLCGKADAFESVVVLNANEIYLTDAVIAKEKQIGLINITTNILVLEGDNKIVTSGVSDSSASFLSAPDIKLNVYDTLGGTGRLKITSTGGDYIKSDKK